MLLAYVVAGETIENEQAKIIIYCKFQHQIRNSVSVLHIDDGFLAIKGVPSCLSTVEKGDGAMQTLI